MPKLSALLLASLIFLGTTSTAYSFCFDEAGAEYGINPSILRAIAKVESGNNPAAVNRNTNGSYDFGLMQINTIWARTLGKERWNALGDACFNTKTGAWILAGCMNKYGYSWKAIGCYNSQTPSKRDVYARKVFKQLQKIQKEEKEGNVKTAAVKAGPPEVPAGASSQSQQAGPKMVASADTAEE